MKTTTMFRIASWLVLCCLLCAVFSCESMVKPSYAKPFIIVGKAKLDSTTGYLYKGKYGDTHLFHGDWNQFEIGDTIK